ncbi:MAG: GNAT family N-acetyltransferase [Nitriliruptorales bacterium]|nr:GNAT family N-acetyltransferase [Nitriliruptorales bacterium]
MNRSVRVREIRPEEHDRVGELLLAAYDDVGPFSQEYRSFLRQPSCWVEDTTATYVAEVDGEVAGCVAFVLPGDREFESTDPPLGDCGFRFLAVAPEAQGSGAGTALVERCLDAARSRGCRRMMIHSMFFMRSAHRLYERFGFVRRPDLDVTFPSGTGYAFTLDLSEDASEHFPEPGPVPDEPPWFEDVWITDGDPAAEASTTPC